MSGGVDSSVSAYLLTKQGYNVVGVFIKVWQPDFLRCHWEKERLDAMRVAAHLGIPFLTCNAEGAYKRDVADYFIAEYKAGRTPNPDVMCNTHVKFGRFYTFAKERGADYIATGHYTRTEENSGDTILLRGKDTKKDQSYFLWNIEKEVLSHVIFPIGNMTKNEVRALAKKVKLPTATKDESQGICFLGHVDIKDFLSHYVTLKSGPIHNEEGKLLGTHDGALLYTIGQRHGLHIRGESEASVPYYVIRKDARKNTLIVSTTKPTYDNSETISLYNIRATASLPEKVSLQTRYRQKPFQARVVESTKKKLVLTPLEKTDASAEGQSCVLYDGERVLGGGIIGNV